MYSVGRRRVPGIVSLGLALILLGVLLAVVSLWRLQTASADGEHARTLPGSIPTTPAAETAAPLAWVPVRPYTAPSPTL
jgi:hypothetical protein